MVEQELMREPPSYLQIQTEIGVAPPLFIALSFLSVKGLGVLHVAMPAPFEFPMARFIDR